MNTPAVSEPSAATPPATTPLDIPTTTTMASKGLESWQIGVIIAVVLIVLLVAAVIAFLLYRKRKTNARSSLNVRGGGSGVYSETTAPIDDETGVMIEKSGDAKYTKERLEDESLQKSSDPEA